MIEGKILIQTNFIKTDTLTELPDSISQPKATISILKRLVNGNDPGDRDSENTSAAFSKPSD